MALADQLAQGIQFAPPPDPFAQYGKMQQLQAGQTQNALAQYQLGAAQRADEVNTNFLRGIQSAGTDEGAIRQAYTSAGKTKEYQDLLNKQAEAAKLRGETANLELTGGEIKSRTATGLLGNKLKIAQVAGSILRGVKDQATYDMAKQSLGHLVPDAVTDYPAAFDPAFIASEMKAGQTLTEGLAAENAARVAATGEANVAATLRGQDMTATTAKASQGVTMRGQDMTAATAAAGQGVTMRGQDMTATTAKTAVSEQQAAYNIGRLLTAANQIKNITEKDTSSLKPGAKEALASSFGMSGTANLARSANRQIVQGAQRDALDALLYLATGAAYNKEQLAGQMDAYIPAFTDTPEAVLAKQVRMTDLIQSAKSRAGKAWTPEMDTSMKALTSVGMPSAVSGKVVPAAVAPAGAGEWKVVK
jgi:hypothetical protein